MSLFRKKPVHSGDSADTRRILNEKTPFAVTEAFKAIYTKILYLPIASSCKKIAITSAVAGEGKTYVACNLAITLAQNSAEKRILLVDVDMRKPRMGRLLKEYAGDNDTRVGLSEYLAGITEQPSVVKSTLSNMDILFSGKESANPVGLINSSRMQSFFDWCADKYDYVIIDSPPAGLVADTVLLSNKIDGYIVTARADYTNGNSLAEVVEGLQNIGAEVFGVVLSSVNPKKSAGSAYSKKSVYY